MEPSNHKKLGLVLLGGGARGAYQAGVLSGIAKIARGHGITNPFDIVSGVSAGAINGACVASSGGGHECARHLTQFWSHLTTNKVFKIDLFSIAAIALSWAADLALGGAYAGGTNHALLNTQPLRHLLKDLIDFEGISQRIATHQLSAFTITATDYTNGDSVVFVWGAKDFIEWKSGNRSSESSEITLEHILGSCAIPFFFPNVKIKDRYFGDGCLRNKAPLSPAVHLGADSLIVVGVKPEKPPEFKPIRLLPEPPTMGTLISTILSVIMSDGITSDLETLERINSYVRSARRASGNKISGRWIDHLFISPSEDINAIAYQELDHVPRLLKYLFRGWGKETDTLELMSHLFFEPAFCKRLIHLGEKDAQRHAVEIERLILSRTQNRLAS